MRIMAPLFRFLSRPARRRAQKSILFLQRDFQPTSILVTIPGHLGDSVIALPVLLAAVSLFPSASFEICLNPAMIPFYRRFLPQVTLTPWIPAWFPERLSDQHRSWRPRTRGQRFDLIIDLRGELQSAWAVWQIPARWRLGLDEFGSSLFFHWAASFGDGRSQQEQLLQPFQVFDPELKVCYPKLSEVGGFRKNAKPVLALATGAGSQSKQWPVESFGELAKLVRGEWPDMIIRIVGSAEDAVWEGEAPDEDGRGRSSPSEAFSDLDGVSLLVANDSFYGHLGALFGVPTVVLFSAANDLERWRPRGPKAESVHVLGTQPECAGCRQRVCDHLRCLEDVGVQEVLRAIRRLLVLNGPESESMT